MREDSKGTVKPKNYILFILGFILLNIMQPLTGIVDVYLGVQYATSSFEDTIQIGVVILTVIYWVVGSLKNVSIIYGTNLWVRKDKKGSGEILIRGMLVATMIGFAIILLKQRLWFIFRRMMTTSKILEQESLRYFSITILGAPFVLASYIIGGWILGCINEGPVIIIHLLGQLFNVGLSLKLAHEFEDVVEALAVGTLSAQILIFVLSIAYIMIKRREVIKGVTIQSLLKVDELECKLSMGINILLRVACIFVVNGLLIKVSTNTNLGLREANLVLLQVKGIMDYIYEGITNATGVYVAKNGELKQVEKLREIHRLTLNTVMGISIAMVIFYSSYRGEIIELFSGTEKIRLDAQRYDGWLLIYPMIAGWGISGYSLFLGCLEAEFVGRSNLIALILFGITAIVIVPMLGNHGLWMALIIFYMVRSLILLGYEDDLYTHFNQCEKEENETSD